MKRFACLVLCLTAVACERVEPRRARTAVDTTADSAADSGATPTSAASATSAVTLPPAAPAKAPERPELLLPGDHQPGRVNTVSGETWLGLFKSDSTWSLRAVDVTVVAIANACTDTAGQKSGRRVGVEGSETPMLLVRGVPGLKPAAVRTVLAERQQLYPGQRRDLDLGSRGRWSIAAYGAVPPPPGGRAGQNAIREYSLVASRAPGPVGQTLFAFRVGANGVGMDVPPAVLWAGELNGDGQLDVFVDLTTGEAPGPLVLYVSNPADTTQLLRKAAEYQPGSC